MTTRIFGIHAGVVQMRDTELESGEIISSSNAVFANPKEAV